MAATSTLIGLGALAAGASAGLQEGQERKSASKIAEEDRRIQREDAARRKEMGDLQLKALRRQDSLESLAQPSKEQQLQAELEVQRVTTNQLNTKLIKTETLTAFDEFFESGDPKSWNYLLKQNRDNPKVKSMFGNTVHFAVIDPAGDRQFLQKLGLPDHEFEVQTGEQTQNVNMDAADGKVDGQVDWDKLKRRFVKAVDAEGNVKLVDSVAAAAAMGYEAYASDKKLKRMQALADIKKSHKPAGSSKPSSFAEKRAAEARYQRALQENRTPTASETAGHQLFLSEVGGDKEVRREHSENAIDQFTKQFGEATQAELLGSPEARKLVRQIETEYGMSKADEARITSLSKVTALSNSASLLSTKETGLMDKAVSGLGGYFADDTKTKVNKMAYSAMLNSVRHSLFGSAQTEGELELFKEAYGSLNQQTGPVLAGLSQAMQQVAAELGSIADRYPEPVVRMRLGKSRADVRKAVEMLDKRVDFYNQVSEGMTPDEISALAKEVFGSGSQQAVETGQGPVEEMSTADIVKELNL